MACVRDRKDQEKERKGVVGRKTEAGRLVSCQWAKTRQFGEKSRRSGSYRSLQIRERSLDFIACDEKALLGF